MTAQQTLFNITDDSLKTHRDTHAISGQDPLILTEIYQPEVHLTCWQRKQEAACLDYAQWLTERGRLLPIRLIAKPDELLKQLKQDLPDHPSRDAFLSDVILLADMLACLFGMEEVGLRLSLLKQAMCPRFHVDRIGARMVCTYTGEGTQWLADEWVDRSKLGHGSNGLPDHQSGLYPGHVAPLQASTGDVIIMKGDTWPEHEGRGVVHRSPECSEKTPRLFLSLDVM